ncbi:hypothetical protein HJG60_008132 [Phyllostomus discolor]|uniref:Uncharacterized protein n=1 Tax=Phyllostomus discolor TaxID=89673 RepID=A0A833ZC95_9CHIR|nr:hypothetical protein HJG60_008132 [Phyllostomus discolor]
MQRSPSSLSWEVRGHIYRQHFLKTCFSAGRLPSALPRKHLTLSRRRARRSWTGPGSPGAGRAAPGPQRAAAAFQTSLSSSRVPPLQPPPPASHRQALCSMPAWVENLGVGLTAVNRVRRSQSQAFS